MPQNTIEERQEALDWLFNEIFAEEMKRSRDGEEKREAPTPSGLSDEDLLRIAFAAKNGDSFKALWNGDISGHSNDDSAADYDLLKRLAFWTGGDAIQMERLFSSSSLGRREKWRDRLDYRERSIQRAIVNTKEFYKPKRIIKGTSEPGLKIVTTDDGKGAIGYDPEKGTISEVCEFEDAKGVTQTFLGAISQCAVHIHTETSACDVTEFVFEGTGAADGRKVQFTMKAADATDKRKFRAVLTNAFGARNQVGKLNFEMVQEISLNPRLVQRIEIPTWCGNIPLLPGLNLADSVEYRLSSKIPAEVCDGDLPAAKEVLRKLLDTHRYAPILAAVVFGSPAIARWHKKDRFGLGLWGLTGTLKTSTALACMGIYGAGYLDEPKLKAGQHGSTVVGAMEIFAAAGFLPQLYDNVKTVNQKDVESYVGMVHAVLEGGEKARGKKDGGLRESRDFSCIPIITGEVRPEEAATSARVLNLNWSGANGPLLTEVQTQAGLLPTIGYHWLKFLADTDQVMGKDFEAFRSKKMQELAALHYTNPGRLATIHSLLVGTWQLLEESPFGDVFSDARESFKAALDDAIMRQGQTVSDETEVSKFLSALEELLAANPGLLQSVDGTKTIMGSIIGKRMAEGIFLLPAETLNEMAKIRAFTQQPTIDSLTQALNEKGYLIPGDSRHLKYHCRLNGSYPRGWYLKDVACPQKNEVIPHSGTDKTNNIEPTGPTFPQCPPEKKENIFSTKNQENRDRLGEGKEKQENCGTSGTSGTIDSIDRLVDSDFDSRGGGPTSDPTVPTDGDTPTKEDVALLERIKSRLVDMNAEVTPFALALAMRGNDHDIGLERCRAWLEAGA